MRIAAVAAVMVVGDVNSTVPATLAATKLHIPAIHLEAGLRSLDRSMPEEINRLATDAISDLLLVSEPAGEKNLRREGVPAARIRYVGNVMIDTLVHHLPQTENQTFGRPAGPFALVTLHRPSNVDRCDSLTRVVDFLPQIAGALAIVFPTHPRTITRLEKFGLLERMENHPAIHLFPPLGYVENLGLMRNARVVLTDSGGIQEETSYLSIPCLTLRENTERPATLSYGTNTRIGTDFTKARRLVFEIVGHSYRKSSPIPGWEGRAAHRVVRELSSFREPGCCIADFSKPWLTVR